MSCSQEIALIVQAVEWYHVLWFAYAGFMAFWGWWTADLVWRACRWLIARLRGAR